MLLWLFVIFSFYCNAQDISYVKNIASQLSSKEYAGRFVTHYSNDKLSGISKAELFIKKEIEKIGAYDLEKYIQKSKNFSKTINFKKIPFTTKSKIFPITYTSNIISKCQLKINNTHLLLGQDFIPEPTNPSIQFSGKLFRYDSTHFINKEHKIIFQSNKKLTYSAAQTQEDFTLIHIKDNVFKSFITDSILIDLITEAHQQKVQSSNIYCFIPGTQYPDSFIIFSAHYDHLGNIDTTYFPGANDNASGVSVLLDLMQYFKKHPLKYSVAFYFFTAEEIGLLGSEYYVKHPLFPLNKIKFLINLDLMGGGSEGIMVVNGKIFEKEFELLKKINEDKSLQLNIKARSKAQNSDHYWFSENGVKCFFIYTLGDIHAYHDIDDKAEKLKFSNYDHIFLLLINFTTNL